jgi:methyltransferase
MLYLCFLCVNAIEMLYEAWISARNSRGLLKKGAIEVAPFVLPFMIAIYAMMFVGSALEFQYKSRQPSFLWAASFLLVYAAAKALKFWAVSALRGFWTMRVLIVPQTKVVTSGPYRWIRHPNYVAVILELAATPLIGQCFLTFAGTLICFSLVLALRIREEENALKKYTDYSQQMGSRRRFL